MLLLYLLLSVCEVLDNSRELKDLEAKSQSVYSKYNRIIICERLSSMFDRSFVTILARVFVDGSPFRFSFGMERIFILMI